MQESVFLITNFYFLWQTENKKNTQLRYIVLDDRQMLKSIFSIMFPTKIKEMCILLLTEKKKISVSNQILTKEKYGLKTET